MLISLSDGSRVLALCAALMLLTLVPTGTLYAQADTNTPLGVNALYSNTTGNSNTALGSHAAYANTEGSRNTAAGYQALRYNTTGFDNVAVGTYSIWTDVDGGQSSTFIAGIVGSPLAEGYSLVGVEQYTGQLGTLRPEDFVGPAGPEGPTGPVGPAGPQGPAGAGLVRGSLVLLDLDAPAPAGWAFIGTTQLTIQLPPGKPGVKRVNVYQIR